MHAWGGTSAYKHIWVTYTYVSIPHDCVLRTHGTLLAQDTTALVSAVNKKGALAWNFPFWGGGKGGRHMAADLCQQHKGGRRDELLLLDHWLCPQQTMLCGSMPGSYFFHSHLWPQSGHNMKCCSTYYGNPWLEILNCCVYHIPVIPTIVYAVWKWTHTNMTTSVQLTESATYVQWNRNTVLNKHGGCVINAVHKLGLV